MCGIAGLIGSDPGDFARLVGPELAHRGPDDAGSWQQGDAVLVHRRLAILDISPAGHQPMASPCGRWQLVFNGEIYNHLSLRERLIDRGHRFRGHSDTETLLAWLVDRGSDGLSDLRGMFAFALLDTKRRSLLLARDPHGIKPLYLWHGPGGELAFASEVRALLASQRVPRRLDGKALAGFLARGSLPEPLTLVAGIRRLPVGHRALWQEGNLTIEPWGPLPETLWHSEGVELPSFQAGPGDALARTRAALEESVNAHLISDVPVGLFLSGGLDSGALLALAPRGLHTFTIGFTGAAARAGFDESSPAARLAEHFGAHHTPLWLEAMQLRTWLPEYLDSLDQPSLDGLNTWCVARLARQQGITVALSGLGGDELFGGYPSFRALPRLLRWRRSLGPAAPLLARALRRTPGGRRHRVQRLAAMLEAPPSLAAAHACFRCLFTPREVQALLRHWGLADAAGAPTLLAAADEPPAWLHQLDQVAGLEGCRYLRNQLLPDSDAMAMAHGLELRLPLVDAVLQRQLAPIPAPQRLAPGKAMLQQAVPELPAWFSSRPKQGFRFPFQLWLDDPLRPLPLPVPSTPAGLDLGPWYRRWSLVVLRSWVASNMGTLLA
jgi:asparagine synthase (glutamine-hydrolysing)